MRILATTNAAIGHFLPMAATIHALVAAGHEVRVGCPASFAPFVRAAGFEPLPCEEVEVAHAVPALPEGVEERLMWAVTLSWPDDCRTWVDALARHAQRWRPEVVMVEPVEHAGRVVAAALDVPLAVHGWGFTLPAVVEAQASAGIADVYERLAAVPRTPALVADLGPAALQAADAGPARRYQYRPFSVPGYPPPPPPVTRPRVLVTLGTYANPEAARLIRTTVAAALDNGTDVVAVLGNDDRGSAETFPPGATVLRSVDMPAAVATCDLVVHHGGAGTSWAALSGGKPSVILPQAGDQFRNAELVAGAGAALVCRSAAPSDLAEAIEHALHDSALTEAALTEAALGIARDNAAMPDLAQLADRIAAVA